MKKVLALLMAAAMILSLAACGSKNPDSNDDSNDKKTALILGTSADYAPFEFMYPDDKGELTTPASTCPWLSTLPTTWVFPFRWRTWPSSTC